MYTIKKKISIVIPIFNEGLNISNLLTELNDALISIKDISFEIIIVDDASTDDSLTILNDLKKKFTTIKIIKNKENYGQSKSIYNAILKAKYKTIVTLDGDGQNDPKDIDKLLSEYFNFDDLKLVGGLRVKRKDSLLKIVSSKIANKVRNFILKDNCKDTGCSLKVFDRNIFLTFPFFDGIHRFLPALYLGFGYKTKYISVSHRKRLYGTSKYGTLKRLMNGMLDIIKVKSIIKKNK